MAGFIVFAAPQYLREIRNDLLIVAFDEHVAEQDAQIVLDAAVTALDEVETYFDFSITKPVRIFPTESTQEFCRRTSAPWWQASVFMVDGIHLQPVRVLQERGILHTTLRHELTHAIVEQKTRGSCPRWLSESLAIYHSGEVEHLKPKEKHRKGDGLKFADLESRLSSVRRQKDLERLYFQLYELGRFLVQSHHASQITVLMNRLAAGESFDNAIQSAFDRTVKALEMEWLENAKRSGLVHNADEVQQKRPPTTNGR